MNDLTKTTDKAPARRDWRVSLETAAPEMAAALPAHVTIDRFKRILASAIGTNNDLKRAVTENPQSVWSSAMAAAKDGLLPDGREAALVVFNTKVKCNDGISRKLATAQYMPMIGGILKMMRQSGEVESLSAHVVHEKDHFDYELGDNEFISHKPALADDRGQMIACYAILKTKDGGIYREIMGRSQVMAVKNIARAKEGPWTGPFEGEMWKKTVLRRLAKRAPLSTDIIDLIQRDDGMYDLDMPSDTNLPAPPPADSGNVLDLTTGEVLGKEVEPEEPTGETMSKREKNTKAATAAAAEDDIEDAEVLDGDDVPEEHGGKTVKAKAKKKPAAKPKEKPKPEPEPEPEPEVENVVEEDDEPFVEDEPTPEEPAEEPAEEPEEVQGDAFETKLKAKRAMRAAESIDDLDGLFALAKACKWYNSKGVPTTFELLYEELKEDLESDDG